MVPTEQGPNGGSTLTTAEIVELLLSILMVRFTLESQNPSPRTGGAAYPGSIGNRARDI
jgi:hypothetical protein